MRTRLENGVLYVMDSTRAVLVTIFIDQGKVEAIKSLSGCQTVELYERQFRAKFKVSTSVIFGLSLFDKVV